MKKLGPRLERLERRAASRPVPGCPVCSGGGMKFVVLPPRVIGEPVPPPAPPRICPACGKPERRMHFVVKPQRALAAGEPE